MKKCFSYCISIEALRGKDEFGRGIKGIIDIDSQKDGFDPSINKSGVPKLYAIIINKEIVYVGIASQGIRARLRYGLNPSKANRKHGYHGYKWRTACRSFHLYVWQFPEDGKLGKNKMLRVESLEAELVFCIRQKKDWPKYQTEIHFHRPSEKIKKEAGEIFSFLRRR